jgi:hypothetical protein
MLRRSSADASLRDRADGGLNAFEADRNGASSKCAKRTICSRDLAMVASMAPASLPCGLVMTGG